MTETELLEQRRELSYRVSQPDATPELFEELERVEDELRRLKVADERARLAEEQRQRIEEEDRQRREQERIAQAERDLEALLAKRKGLMLKAEKQTDALVETVRTIQRNREELSVRLGVLGLNENHYMKETFLHNYIAWKLAECDLSYWSLPDGGLRKSLTDRWREWESEHEPRET
jgi:DNA repair exonuclease SbcCD ATPase subunit